MFYILWKSTKKHIYYKLYIYLGFFCHRRSQELANLRGNKIRTNSPRFEHAKTDVERYKKHCRTSCCVDFQFVKNTISNYIKCLLKIKRLHLQKEQYVNIWLFTLNYAYNKLLFQVMILVNGILENLDYQKDFFKKIKSIPTCICMELIKLLN